MKKFLFTIFFCSITGFSFAQISHQLVVNVKDKKAVISPTMWGIFFEDINLAADGGLYAELVKNRSFEFATPLMGWKEARPNGGNILILNRSASNTGNPRFARISVEQDKNFTIANEGFRGMGIKKDNEYFFSVWARSENTGNGKLKIQLLNATNEKIGEAVVRIDSKEWKKYSVSFIANATEAKAKMNLVFEGTGVYDIDMVSLFPKDTWKQRPGGLRNDLVQLLADLKPGFVRFPGGCIVEGRDLANRYQWKKTVGNVEDRQLIINRWNTEFANRSTPDYFQSFGLGFYEYFLLSEDLGASPLPIINCGLACQFNTAEAVPVDDLQPYIQDALDLIEFANGTTQTKWGKLRAEMGHDQPFNLKMLGVGNENWGPQYIERLKIFTNAIKAKYPHIQLVNSSGTDPSGERFDLLNTALRKMNADIIDEHYYRPPEWFLQNANRYDYYDRNGSKVFAGEYAAHAKNLNGEAKSIWYSALSEAAFMTGLERNADVVTMASYAPLLAHVDGWQWAPDLIWFDNLRSYGTPEYYVQKLFSNNKGSQVIAVSLKDSIVTGQDSLYAAAAFDAASNEIIIKLVNVSNATQVNNISLRNVQMLGSTAAITILKGMPGATNSLNEPTQIHPEERNISFKKNEISITSDPYSFSIIRIKIK